MENHTAAEKDEFKRIQMEKFAFQAEETIDAQQNLFIQEAGAEVPRKEDAHGRLVIYLEDRLQSQYLESSSQNSACEVTEYERQWLPTHESDPSQEVLRRDFM